MPLDFSAPKVKLEDVDLPRIGSEIGVGEDELHAVLEVETSGGAADSRGRLKMLFEPHVFYRNLKGAKRDAAVAAGVAYPNWRSGYPADSYPRLEKAMAIDETAALKACSWGLGQILGENHKAAGYPTPQAMVKDFTLDEDNHLEAMVRFIIKSGLHRAIARHDWAAFAHGYNGPKYATHNYHGRLAAAFAKWKKIKDTPWDGRKLGLAVGGTVIDVTPTVVSDAIVPAEPPATLPNPNRTLWANPPIAGGGTPPATAPKKRDGLVLTVFAAVGAGIAAAYTWLLEHLPEIMLGLVVLIALAAVVFRLKKGHWPWTSLPSTGARSPVPSLPPPQKSAASLEQLSAHLAGLSALSPATSSPASLASRPRPRTSGARSRTTRRRPTSSRSSRKTTAKKSSRARRSKSKG